MVGPKKPNFRYWVEYLGFRLMGAVFSAMPVDTASNIAGALMARVGPLSMKRQPRLMRNLTAAFPEMTVAQRDKLAREVWRNIGRVIGEFFHIDAIMRDRIEVANPELLVEAATSGKGAVLCGAHQANWEAVSAVFSNYGLKPMGVYRPISNPFVDAEMMRRRGKYFGSLMAKHDRETPVALMRHVRGGGAAGLLFDQESPRGAVDALLRPPGPDDALSGADRAPVQRAAAADPRLPYARRALQGVRHPDRGSAHRRPQGRHLRRDRGPAGRTGKIHPPASRPMDVDPRQVAVTPSGVG